MSDFNKLDEKVCSVEGCNGKKYARGWCRKHYRHVVEGGHKEPLPIITHCKSCQVEIPEKAGSTGLCKVCYRAEWETTTEWDNQAYKKQYREANKEKIDDQVRNWRINNREHTNRYYAKRRKDPQFRLRHNIRSRLYDALKGKTKHSPSSNLIGCSWEELKNHLENQFTSDMSWDNYGKHWSLDHIVPLVAFDLTIPEQLEKASHYSNLRPLRVSENASKATEDKKWKK